MQERQRVTLRRGEAEQLQGILDRDPLGGALKASKRQREAELDVTDNKDTAQRN